MQAPKSYVCEMESRLSYDDYNSPQEHDARGYNNASPSSSARYSTGSQRAYKQGRAQARHAQHADYPARKQGVVVRSSDWNANVQSRATYQQNQAHYDNQYDAYPGQTQQFGGKARVDSSWSNSAQYNQPRSARGAARNKAQQGYQAQGQGGYAGAYASQDQPYRAEVYGADYQRPQRDLITGKGAVARKRGMPGVVKFLLLLLLVALIALGVYWWMLNDRLSLQGEDTGDLVDATLRDPFYMLVLGSDSREHSGSSSKASESGDQERSDVMILLRVDQANSKLTMLSIPRDTPIRDEEGNVMRINEAFNRGGARYAIQKVQEITGAPISHYAQVRMSNFEEAVDNLGGLDMNVPIELSVKDTLTGETITVPAGQQHVNGKQAQALARARHEYQVDQDVNRQGMVRQLVVAMLKTTLDRPIYAIPGAVLDVASCVGTDLSSADLMYLAAAFSGKMENLTIYSATGPTAGDWRDDLGGNWYCYDNPEGWANVMAVIDAGEDPSGVDVNATAIIP